MISAQIYDADGKQEALNIKCEHCDVGTVEELSSRICEVGT